MRAGGGREEARRAWARRGAAPSRGRVVACGSRGGGGCGPRVGGFAGATEDSESARDGIKALRGVGGRMGNQLGVVVVQQVREIGAQ